MKISDIVIGTRHRTDLGDLEALAASIKMQGLLQPVGVTENNELVFGFRRLTACRDILGWTAIDHRVVNVTNIVSGEYTENEVRKDFTTSERVAILRTIETIGAGRPSKLIPFHGKKLTKEQAIKLAGFGGTGTAWRAEQLVDNAPDLAEKVDRKEMSLRSAFLKAEKEGRLKHKNKKPGKEKQPKRINPPYMSLGTLPSGEDIGQPPEGFTTTDERMAWREKVHAKVVLHPLRIKQLMEDKEIVEQMGTALAILERSAEFPQFRESLERLLSYRRPTASEEPGDKIDFVQRARDARSAVMERLDGALAKLHAYYVLIAEKG